MRKKLLLVRKRGSVLGWAVLLVGTLVGGRAAAVGQPAAASHAELDVDDDGDGFPAGEDCDDNDPAVHPDAAEICDAIDNDCDETTAVDQGTPCYDEDEDGYSPLDGDCDDQDPSCHPGAVEIVGDMMDNDCDRLVDESPSVDRDGDGYSADQGDCDDGDPTVHPAAAEEPLDRRDNDCDGEVDEPLPVGAACATHRGGQRPGPATLSWAVLVALLVRRRFAVRGRSGRRRWRSGGKMTRTVARILGLSMFCLLWGCPVDDDDAADDDDSTPPVGSVAVGLCNDLKALEDIVELYVTPDGGDELEEALGGGVIEWYACAWLNLVPGTFTFRAVDEFGFQYCVSDLEVYDGLEWWFSYADESLGC